MPKDFETELDQLCDRYLLQPGADLQQIVLIMELKAIALVQEERANVAKG